MKLALITGGSRGLGAALVETYLQAGWEVREFSRSGTSAIHRDLDLASPDSIQQAIKSVQQEFASAKLEELLLIHNAGSLGAMKLTDRLKRPATRPSRRRRAVAFSTSQRPTR